MSGKPTATTVTIDVWLNDYLIPGYLDPVHRLVQRFGEEHPGIDVRVRGIDFRDMPAEVAHAAGDGTPPAVAEYFYTATQLARDTRDRDGRPLFVPVQRAIAGRTEILGEPVVTADLLPAIREYFSYRGELMSLPMTASTVVLYGNLTLLRAAGIDELPRTWQEVRAACAALGDRPGVTWPNHGWMVQQAVAQQGGLLVEPGNGRQGRARTVALASKELLAFATWWKELHDAGHYLYSGTVADWPAVSAAFAGQEVALALTTSVEAVRLKEAGIRGGFEVGVAPMPRNADAPFAGNYAGGDSLWLRDGLPPAERDAALAFLLFLLRPEHVADWHKANQRIPVTRTAVRMLEQEGWFDANPELRAPLEQLDASDGTPAALGPLFGDVPEVEKAIVSAMHDVLTTGADPVLRFTEANQRAQQALEDYNAVCGDGVAAVPRLLTVGW